MFQHAVRAPNIFEIFETPEVRQASDFEGSNDFCSASRDPVGNGLSEVCVAQGLEPSLLGIFESPEFNFLTILRGGNPDLEPEEADSMTAGVIIQPVDIPALTLSLDYFDIEIEGAITNIEGAAASVCAITRDPLDEFCQAFSRGPTGNITEFVSIPRNVAVQKSEGLDFQLDYSRETPALALFDGGASISLAYYLTWYKTNGSRSSPASPFINCAGFFGFACQFSSFGTLPEFKSTTRLTYNSGPLRASLRWRWIDGMDNSYPLYAQLNEITDDYVLAIPSIGSQNTFDLSGSYDINTQVSVHGGINNLLNNGPPLLAGAQIQANTDPSTFDPIGRRYFLGVSVHF
jgi:outer membrane receptor protein involved in Fe transport